MIIARSPDGLILAELQDGTGAALAEGRHRASQLLAKVGGLSPRCSVECGGAYVFHLLQGEGVFYLAMFDRSYPRNYAFAFLEDIEVIFQEELKREFGTGSVDHRSHIDTIEKPYYFVRLDRHFARKKAEYRDPSSSSALSRLHAQLTQVSGIMQHNIDEILSRGESLEDVSRKGQQLSASSLELSGTAKRLALQSSGKIFGTLIVLGLLVAALYIVQQFATDILFVVGFVCLTWLCVVGYRSQGRRSVKVNASDSLQFVELCHDSHC